MTQLHLEFFCYRKIDSTSVFAKKNDPTKIWNILRAIFRSKATNFIHVKVFIDSQTKFYDLKL